MHTSKTFTENWDSTAPSVGTLLPRLETNAQILFQIDAENLSFLSVKKQNSFIPKKNMI